MHKKVSREGKKRWVPTKVNLDDHIIVPKLDPNMDFPDQFLEDYVTELTQKSMDTSKPLWELHLLNVKTSDAEAVGVFKIHHSIGDGVSLISLFLACTRKSSDPEQLPTVPVRKRRSSNESFGISWCFWIVWLLLRLVFNTFVDVMVFAATSCGFLKDSDSPIKGRPGVELRPKIFVHKTFSLDDIKFVKNAMDVVSFAIYTFLFILFHVILISSTAITFECSIHKHQQSVNDVLLGITQAGISRYLDKRYGMCYICFFFMTKYL